MPVRFLLAVMNYRKAALLMLFVTSSPAMGAPHSSYYLEDLTWPEVKERMQAGTDTIIIPTGGSEQNGPHIAIGKHNWIVRYTSGAIARELGNALAAPVLAYVPEGPPDKAQGHMAFPGTISVREESFAMILEDTARSFKLHGFKRICFIGDSGGNQDAQARVADKLTKEWKNEGVTVLQVGNYYSSKDAEEWITAEKIGVNNPTAHAGFMDTAEILAAHKDAVRPALVKPYSQKDADAKGVVGDPSKASEAYGKKLLGFKVNAAVGQIRQAFAPAKKF